MKKTLTARLFAALLAAIMLLTLAACGESKDPTAGTSATPNNQTSTTAAPDGKSFTVTFNTLGGSAVEAQKVKDGEKAAKPADPTKDGFLFSGWAKDEAGSSAFDFDSEKISADVTLYAVWADASNAAKATFHLNYEGALDIAS